MSTQQVTSFGFTFEVDTSDKACQAFGFQHNDQVLTPSGGEATVIGVAPLPDHQSMPCVPADTDVLWIHNEGDANDEVCCVPPSHLRGFTRKPIAS